MHGNSTNRDAMIVKMIKRFIGPALFVSTSVLLLTIGIVTQSAQLPKPEEMNGKTAGEYYKNIQVLKNVPASELLPGMRYITTALGVKCDYCHVNPFSSDAKPEKQTAHRMMTMLTAINANNFGGRPEVSCYTCHQGRHEPMGVPALPAEAVEPQFIRPAEGVQAQTLPTADAILDKFAQAQGGDAASKIATREIQAQESADGQTFTVDAYQKAPDKIYAVTNLPHGQMTSGFDGARAWVASNHDTEDADPQHATILRTMAEIDVAAAIRNYTGRLVRGQAKIGATIAYVMQAKSPGGTVEFLFFDESSGLLIRRMIRQRTIFGALPLEADYSDYRSVDGVNIPFKTTWFSAGQATTLTIQDVKQNTPVDDSKFEPPTKQQ